MVRPRPRLVALGLLLASGTGLGCGDAVTEASAMQKPLPVKVTPTPAKPSEPARPTPTPLTGGQTVTIAAGKVLLGSAPGTIGRDPSREADLVSIELPAFDIDRLPYPNDPALPPLTNISRDEAAQRCSEAGKRLCTEQEWERACESDTSAEFPMGAAWDIASCADNRVACDSNLGVSELGLRVREWTASTAPEGIGVSTRTAVTRGSTTDAPAPEHRCSARNAATPDSRSDSIGFRCCSGETTASVYPTEPARPLTAPLEMSADALRTQLKAVPELAPYADTFAPLDRADIARALARGERSADGISLWTITPSVFTWSPMPGEEIVVVAGHVGEAVLLAALYPHQGKWIHGASTLLHDKDSSVAIGARADEPESLVWTSCWGCYGEGGRLSIGADRRVGFHFR